MNKKILSIFMLLVVATVWGLSFMIVSDGMKHIGTFIFSGIRALIAAFLFYLFMFFYPKIVVKKQAQRTHYTNRALALRGGLISGVLFFININIQQIGISQTTSGKAGFITSLYIILIPIMGSFFGEKASKKLVLCILASTFGFYFLSIDESFTIARGDLFVFIAAMLISLQALILGKYSKRTNTFELNFYQFTVMGILSLITGFFVEKISLEGIMLAMPAILYMGVLNGFIASALQLYSFRYIGTTVSMLICSLEAIIAVIGGYFFLGEVLTSREILGCLIVFLSIVVSQLPDNKKIKKLRI